ncbi:MAG: hypothetical protein QOG68_1992 [Solirubrobacteraceae bacterium]|nr:hypothetical protein [Solirubrobacteraceae bacterium]
MTHRVALVGAGDWARTALAPALSELPDAEIVACVDPDEGRAAALAAVHGAQATFPSIADLASSALAPDVVVISTPDRHHVDAIEAAVAMGAAVYCEKPLAASADEAWRLARLTAGYPRPTTVGFNFRYSAAVQQLKDDLVSGLLGRPWLIETQERNSQFHPEVGRAMTWKGDPRHASGGALIEYGAHVLDLDRWLVGPPIEVSARLLLVSDQSQLDDVAVVQLVHDNDALGTFAASWVLAGGFPGIRVVVHGSRGTAEVVLDDARPVAETYRRYDLSGHVAAERDYEPVARHAYAQRQLTDLLAMSAGRAPAYADTLPTIADAAKIQALLDRALAS